MSAPRLCTVAALAALATLPFGRSAAAADPLTTDIGTLDHESAEKAFSAAPYSPYAGRSFPTRPFFGDTHLHTSFSMDAGAFGARLGPKEAYRFAKGEEVTASSGQRAKLSRPLDFLVVTDHSDNMGFFPDLLAGKPEMLADPTGRRWYDMVQEGKGADAAIEIIVAFSQGKFPPALLYSPGSTAYRSAWRETIKAAEEANDPGRFTAFIGYEWTSNTGGNNLHRNVIFRDDGRRASMVEPFTVLPPLGSDNPRDLWKWMTAYEQKTGGNVLAIAHNGNLSNGRMFPVIESFGGKPIDRAYAETRARWERLYEATQIKGDGETHPFLSPNDEFASFERWDKGNLDLSELKKPEMLQYEYARSALKTGLKLEQQLGVNPYKFGMVGSTDAHTGLTAVEEDNFFGKTTSSEPSKDRATHPFVKTDKAVIMGWEQSSSGYAAVWANENTRESIFDAMQRKEVYATTGPRMVVRFFGSFDFEASDAKTRMPATIGYRKGVPMGGDLRDAPKGKAPTFLVAALKDPIGANLDRIQIVKGWLDRRGELQEKIYDVAWSDKRTPGADGKLPPVGNTVDVPNASYSNSIGEPELITVWRDPDFDAGSRAFYYARVIEIPTPRWTAYDAKYFKVKMPPEVPTIIQERAYTSPIWYTPRS
ncbi:DUF3604 domain-containing protein [Pararobbsia alpina]|uniref:DUF3604 domain-containing protein n=1 Tax=Pararobbsia alpina TaxID=621374 RepID=A0A6S7CYL5_9BURK|nr:DUF3604 domain-containing protein [Pararobbsia alpina]CAB3801255.1 hypothetical protein LMG28138_04981 [Pararobbsia alpina]